MSYNVPTNIYNAVESYAQSDHVPDAIWETVVFMESGFNPNAHNPSGAYGLFQLLTPGGQGDNAIRAGHTVNDLYNPSINAQYGMPAVSSAWKNLEPSFDPNSLNWWEEFASQSGHPGGSTSNSYTDQVAQTMMRDYQQHVGSTTPQTDPYPGGSINPMNWSSEAQSTAQSTVNNAAATVASNVTNWITTNVGPFLLRIAVGGAGIGLIFLGSEEVVDTLKGIPTSYQDSSQRAKSKPATEKTPEKKPAKKEPIAKKEEKPAPKKEPDKKEPVAKKEPAPKKTEKKESAPKKEDEKSAKAMNKATKAD